MTSPWATSSPSDLTANTVLVQRLVVFFETNGILPRDGMVAMGTLMGLNLGKGSNSPSHLETGITIVTEGITNIARATYEETHD
jgi:hypothetical protein